MAGASWNNRQRPALHIETAYSESFVHCSTSGYSQTFTWPVLPQLNGLSTCLNTSYSSAANPYNYGPKGMLPS